MTLDLQHASGAPVEGESESFTPLVAVDRGPAEPSDLERARALAESHRLPLVDLAVNGPSPEATKLVPLRILERVVAMPYAVDGGVVRIAITDPDNVHGIDELRLAVRMDVEFAIAPVEDVQLELRRLNRAAEAFGAMVDDESFFTSEDADADDLEVDDGVSDGPLVRLVNAVIFQAAEDGASDVHFEPQEDALTVRFRVDGVLRVIQRVPKHLQSAVITRLKVLAKLDIAERRKPQDGRITLTAAAAGRMLDIRVATLPTVEGEA
ncbi:MAG: GspE/PulE family protein, partial [Gaiellaceae bacterium]